MLIKVGIVGLLMMVTTVTIHALGTDAWVRLLKRHPGWLRSQQIWLSLVVLISTAVVLLTLNAIEATLWAGVYWTFAEIQEINTLETAIYFSLITFTTLGYGDITLSSQWQLLSGIEAMNGIFLFGWSAALLYAVVQRIWGTQEVKSE
jgi:hypothetical protein